MIVPVNVQEGAFDFKHESEMAAVNEACAGSDSKCSIGSLCQECQALAVSIEYRLRRAYAVGMIVASQGRDGDNG